MTRIRVYLLALLVALLVAVLLALITRPAHSQPPPLTAIASADAGLYSLHWLSALPLDVATIHAEVSGSGTLLSISPIGDGREGDIWASAPAACLGIAMRATTTTGVAVQAQARWWEACPRIYLPLVAR